MMALFIVLWLMNASKQVQEAIGEATFDQLAKREETLAAAENQESRVRIILTRGSGKMDLDPAAVDDTQLVVIVLPLGAPPCNVPLAPRLPLPST